MAKKLLGVVPNYSEGRDMEKVAKIAACFRDGENVRFLDCRTDVNHDRCVATAVGKPEVPRDAVIDSFEVTVQLIDTIKHEGQHPRISAVNMVSFVPHRNTTVVEADVTAKKVGKAVGEKFGIPIFLYEDSATALRRINLAKTRKGQLEGMTEELQDKGFWAPSFGPDHIYPTVGVVATSARMPFTAYNVNLDTDNMEIANYTTDTIKNIRGGYHFIKAIGVELRDHYPGKDTVVQVSISLVNYEKIAIYRAFEVVKMKARRYSVNVLESEVVGVVPMQSSIGRAEYYLQVYMLGPTKFDAKKQIMENQFLEDEEERT